MDFVTGLPSSNGFDTIWVVVDRLTKLRHFAPCSTTIDAKGLAELFLSNIFRLHGLPETIVSDRGPQFASHFWKHLCHALKIEPRVSTAFHPETDGQTECTNAIMEQYLRAYINYQQDDWLRFLPMAEFAANNHISEITGISPFFANYGLNPKIDFELDIRVDNHEECQAQGLAECLSNIHDLIHSEMSFAQDRQQEYVDRHR
jgi:transposase InsO family protein